MPSAVTTQHSPVDDIVGEVVTAEVGVPVFGGVPAGVPDGVPLVEDVALGEAPMLEDADPDMLDDAVGLEVTLALGVFEGERLELADVLDEAVELGVPVDGPVPVGVDVATGLWERVAVLDVVGCVYCQCRSKEPAAPPLVTRT